MRILVLIIWLIFSGISVFGQADKEFQIELDSMCLKTIQSQYLFIQNGVFYVENNELTKRLKQYKELDYLKFLTNEELTSESIKTKRRLMVIRATYKVLSKDTVDINIGYLDFEAKRKLHFNNGLKFKKANYMLHCGGTVGYKPTSRFVYNDTEKKWKSIINE